MSKATGKARHPHDSKRPTPKGVKNALEADDIKALETALTPRQRAFAREYVVDFNASAAALRAGYSKAYVDRQAYILIRHEGVKRLVDELMTSKEAKITAIDPDYVVAQVTAIISKPEAKDGDRLRGLELLARHLGMFIDRTEITGRDGEAIQYEKVQNEAADFARAISGLAARRAEDEAPSGTTH